MTGYLYRYFDGADVLLYVGRSVNGLQRLIQHESSKPWFHQVRRVEIAPVDDFAEAEARAIQTESPLYNIQLMRASKKQILGMELVIEEFARIRHGRSLREISIESGCSLTYLRRVGRGEQRPGKKMLEYLGLVAEKRVEYIEKRVALSKN